MRFNVPHVALPRCFAHTAGAVLPPRWHAVGVWGCEVGGCVKCVEVSWCGGRKPKLPYATSILIKRFFFLFFSFSHIFFLFAFFVYINVLRASPRSPSVVPRPPAGPAWTASRRRRRSRTSRSRSSSSSSSVRVRAGAFSVRPTRTRMKIT